MATWISRSTRSFSHFLQRAGSLSILHQRGLRPFSYFESTKGREQIECPHKYEKDNYHLEINLDENQALDFPGGKIPFTSQMKFIPESSETRLACYRVLDKNGYQIPGSVFEQVSKDLAVKMYRKMVTLQIMDSIFDEAKKQGRLSFYLTTLGEEVINIASAAALTSDDIVLPQYREPGVLLWRGFTLQEFANQLLGNKGDNGKGRQMPIHYGSNKLNYFTVSSTIATQLPQAVGVAYSLKMDTKEACVVTYFGDGTTSEGDFHAALNLAAVLEVPVIFVCRNNGWAISTPVAEQFRSDGIAIKGQAYGVRSIRVDGNDALAVYSAIRAARKMAIKEQRPILVEAMAYRVGDHASSDDSTKYRSKEEIEYWRRRSSVARFRKWIQKNGWWSDVEEFEFRGNIREQVLQAIQVAEKEEKPPLVDLFTDVYDQIPSNLQEQERYIRDAVKRGPKEYPSNMTL
ncbi:2-oxoisovalerate dehydrogenase subunit alpha 1, mitochondrial-like isoform X1 [Nicotiana sylvestris]|uniref:3-methyl-2-oxobutanoate dehydrogenase (2-methylpropanoyl-transferring) n=1 Tax=Nicotiana sylvestris TaxID=4096 RepID=A0A1U7WWH5_NICSY|nr:PREDICTED: 2-oxoisovalerate dehydrogenase subunit alpha 1, mitochondrial-like isoform X1 [Nicotiana sylvestris]